MIHHGVPFGAVREILFLGIAICIVRWKQGRGRTWPWVVLPPRWAILGPQVPGMKGEGLECSLLLHSWSPPLLMLDAGCLHSPDSRVNPVGSLPWEGQEPPQATPTFCTGEECPVKGAWDLQ